MDGQSRIGSQQINPYLSPHQQDLLLAALGSQSSDKQRLDAKPATGDSGLTKRNTSDASLKQSSATMSTGTMFQSPGDMDNFNGDFTPGLDYLDGDGSFDFDNADLGGDMIGALPGSGAPEQHEKRKSPDENGSPEEGDAKRQETQEGERGSKKPGRKPLTSEPTTKRKAQNRAAQRAFRERKEQHLKDLETKVTELTKTQEADKQENGLLKAQVERLQVELKEYRKRLSLNGGSSSRSPPLSASGSQSKAQSASSYGQSSFQFDFPKFGGLPGSQMFGTQNGSQDSGRGSQRNSATPPTNGHSPGSNGSFSQQPAHPRANSGSRNMSPRNFSGTQIVAPKVESPESAAISANTFDISTMNFAPYSTNDNMHGFASTLPQMGANGSDAFGDLFSPNLMKSVTQSGNNNYFNSPQQIDQNANTSISSGGDSQAGIPDNRVFRFNSGSNASDSASPSASSLSQWNANGTSNSSCGTSPEPSHDSPANKDKSTEQQDKTITQNSYSGNNNAFMNTQQFNTNLSNTNLSNFNSTINNNDNYNMPQLNNFDPVMFGEFRDNQDNMFNDANLGGDFNSGFFDEALNANAPFDYGSPSNLFGILQNVPQSSRTPVPNAPVSSRNLMAEIERTRNGGDDDYGLPTAQASQAEQQRQRLAQATPKKTDSSGKLISCNNIWNQLQSNPDFQDGKFDLDGLCSELRAKARCSESGVMVDQDHVDQALKKLGSKDENGKQAEVPALMFEQDSWDSVLRKLQGGQ